MSFLDTPLPAYSPHGEVPFCTREQFIEIAKARHWMMQVHQVKNLQPDPIVYDKYGPIDIPYRISHEMIEQLIADGILEPQDPPRISIDRWFIREDWAKENGVAK